MLLRNM